MTFTNIVQNSWYYMQTLYNKFTETSLFLKLVVVFSFCQDNMRDCMDRIYERFPMLSDAVDFIYNTSIQFYCQMWNIKYEPSPRTNWYYLIVEYLDDNHDFVTYEQYNEISNNCIKSDLFQQCYKTTTNIKNLDKTIYKFGTIIESLCIIKYFHHYICRIIKTDQSEIPLIQDLETTTSQFLSIEYTHPSMEEPITMEIDRGYYAVNNEILSSSFVKRYLEYQNKPYIYDLQYNIVIMGSDMNLISLGCEEFILITKDGYEVKKLNS